MPKVAKIAISLPERLLDDIDGECDSTGETRSEFFRRAVHALLRGQRQRQAVDEYIRGYTQRPEGAEEIGLVQATSARSLSDSPWESGGSR